ncbi:MAG: hypothetical protein QME68_06725, partial [Elusimicrobiota bacterium]|nr:hypothetical protein [Elusimicrobiota bacterium]
EGAEPPMENCRAKRGIFCQKEIKFQLVDMNELIEKTLFLLNQEFEFKKIKIIKNFSDQLSNIYVSPAAYTTSIF